MSHARVGSNCAVFCIVISRFGVVRSTGPPHPPGRPPHLPLLPCLAVALCALASAVGATTAAYMRVRRGGRGHTPPPAVASGTVLALAPGIREPPAGSHLAALSLSATRAAHWQLSARPSIRARRPQRRRRPSRWSRRSPQHRPRECRRSSPMTFSGLARLRSASIAHTGAHSREAQSTASAGQGVGARRRDHRHPRH